MQQGRRVSAELRNFAADHCRTAAEKQKLLTLFLTAAVYNQRKKEAFDPQIRIFMVFREKILQKGTEEKYNIIQYVQKNQSFL